MIDAKQRAKYTIFRSLKTPSGRPAVDCDDDVARFLRGRTEQELALLAMLNGETERWGRWRTLSPGHRKMNLANTFRAKIIGGTMLVDIGGTKDHG